VLLCYCGPIIRVKRVEKDGWLRDVFGSFAYICIPPFKTDQNNCCLLMICIGIKWRCAVNARVFKEQSTHMDERVSRVKY
jgi:hypothetical protein